MNSSLAEGMTVVPDYWRVLAAPVSPQQGLPPIHNIRISEIKALDAMQAFGVSAYAEAVLRDFEFRKIDIEAKTAGSIQNAENWKFTDTRIDTVDGSRVKVTDSKGITGLE
jgi:hypothetical protein